MFRPGKKKLQSGMFVSKSISEVVLWMITNDVIGQDRGFNKDKATLYDSATIQRMCRKSKQTFTSFLWVMHYRRLKVKYLHKKKREQSQRDFLSLS